MTLRSAWTRRTKRNCCRWTVTIFMVFEVSLIMLAYVTYLQIPVLIDLPRPLTIASPFCINANFRNIAYLDAPAPTDFYFSPYHHNESLYSPNTSSRLEYSETIFRSLKSVPILWIDEYGDTRWNEAAEREMYNYLVQKQTINVSSVNETLHECLHRQLLIINAHEAGFFSRHMCFIEQFGQTLYSPSMALLSYRSFHASGSDKEDFRGEGVLRYFLPMSTCAKLDRHPQMTPILQRLRGNLVKTANISSINDLLYENQRQLNVRFITLSDIWTYGYENVPHRQWLFNINRSLTPINYILSTDILVNHPSEHIYSAPFFTPTFLAEWRAPNEPYGQPSKHLTGSSYQLTWQDRAFTSFLRYMFMLFFHRFPPRIYEAVHLLAEHWSSYLHDKSGQTLHNMGAIFIRRGDKMPEDSFWVKHKRWRNISYYVKGLVDEENQRGRQFSPVFIMTNDLSVMNSILDFSNPISKGTDEPYARQQLKGRHILYNVFAPQACFNPFIRIGFDQFLVTLEFIVQYSQFTVSHTDSNVGRYLEQIIFGKRQLNETAHLKSYINNAPDSF
jgi:hypothetical protein